MKQEESFQLRSMAGIGVCRFGSAQRPGDITNETGDSFRLRSMTGMRLFIELWYVVSTSLNDQEKLPI